ncbi:hypothetical protein BJX61DRAFT_112372 [Aspergillus egyptiacus]|nr:hypothetical protein BJX61DRAFT_112372 [Aspergillus egyptiacus]
MADVRSMLRNELASRRGSPQTGSSTPNRITKKRKVDPTDSHTRKKVRHASSEQPHANTQIRPPSAQLIAEEEEDDVGTLPQDVMKTDTPTQAEITEEPTGTTTETLETPSIPPAEPAVVTNQTIDEDEWAAFEREVVAPTRAPQKPAAVAAGATISAAPISTEELAALQEREKETMRRNREAEAEGEREDAARFLEEEFDEMEQLEERVRRLKQMREQLRAKRGAESSDMDESASPAVVPPEPTAHAADDTSANDQDEENEDEDEDDIDDEWDNWRFR